MGHVVNSDREYRLLQQRLDRTITGAPASPVLDRIVRMLYRPDDVDLAVQIPFRITPLPKLAKKTGIPEDDLCNRLTEMAGRGLMLDFEYRDEHYFALPPLILGFFEFTFMRARDELPMAELAALFEEYMRGDDRLAKSVYQHETQIGRALVQEEALPEEDVAEVLDWERASEIVDSADTVAVSRCACRHKAEHLGHACDAPQEVCLAFNYAARTLIRSGTAREIDRWQGREILKECKQYGLVQIADNIRRRVTYICNCCCAMLDGIRRFKIRTAVATSCWYAEIDPARCSGCGVCESACPIDAIQIKPGESSGSGENGRYAVVDPELCLGCGVCRQACKWGALWMRPRAQKVIPPDTLFDRYVAMAIERGKLADLIFDDYQRLDHRALRRILGVLERTPVWRATLAVKPLKSALLNMTIWSAKLATRPFSDVMT